MRPGPLRGAAFEAFVAPARGRRGLWRLLLGLAVAGLVWILAGSLILMLGWGAMAGAASGTILALLTFAGLTLGVVLSAWLFDRRGPATLIGPGGFRPRAFLAGAGIAAGFVGLGLLGPALLVGGPALRGADPGAWLALLPLALLAVLIQTSAEELAFRGYLAQGIAARSRRPVLWLGLPAALFGALHWSPGLGPNAPLLIVCAAAIGVVLGDVTARAGNLSLAMGLHFGNNAVALLLIAPSEPLGGLALYTWAEASGDAATYRAALLMELALLSACYGLWLRWNRPRNRRV